MNPVKYFELFVIFLLGLNGYAQVSFEKGYYIDVKGNKVNCLIEDNEWRANPASFKYKLSIDSEVFIQDINLVSELKVGDYIKYMRESVQFDVSELSVKIKSKASSREPVFQKKELFLKVLLEGEFNLYQYVSFDKKIFFYKNKNDEIKQLLNKTYINNENQPP